MFIQKGTFSPFGFVFSQDQVIYNFSYNVPVFEKKCLPSPELWLYNSVISLCFILIVLLLLVVLSSKLNQLSLIVSEHFFSRDAEKRIARLHVKILKKRNKWKVKGFKTSWKSFTMQVGWLYFGIFGNLMIVNIYRSFKLYS